jgi:4-hydroxybenzoate polyprenyltransferase
VIVLAIPASVKSPQLLVCTLSFLCLIWAYSAPPLRLKERPILDSLSNGVICWLFWACGYVSDGHASLHSDAEPTSKQGRLVFLYASALHSMAAMVDSYADSSAKYRTIATVYGERFAAMFSMICLSVYLQVAESY